eukprot:6202811-Pleurochrysis_carterae.AAC.3
MPRGSALLMQHTHCCNALMPACSQFRLNVHERPALPRRGHSSKQELWVHVVARKSAPSALRGGVHCSGCEAAVRGGPDDAARAQLRGTNARAQRANARNRGQSRDAPEMRISAQS